MRNSAPTLLIACVATLLAAAPANAALPVRDQVYEPTCVSSIAITAPQESIDNLYADPKGEYQPVSIAFDVCGSGVNVYGPLNVTMRLKGSGSFRTLNAKAAFRVKLPSGQRIDGIKNLTLNNMVQDHSMLRESLAYRAFAAAGQPAPRNGYATVTLNGAPYGLYTLVETLDDRFLARHFATTKHLYEQPDWQLGHTTHASRDVLPAAVPHFEVDEGDEDDVSDLEELAAATELADGDEWWTAFQRLYNVESVLRFWATDVIVGDRDSYVSHVNNYHLHNTAEGLFSFLPWGKDAAFTRAMPMMPQPDQVAGAVFRRCLAHADCRARYATSLDYVAERLIAADLVGLGNEIHATIAQSVAGDPRKESTDVQQCRDARAVLEYIIRWEDDWIANFRTPGPDDAPAGSRELPECHEPQHAPLPEPDAAQASVSIISGARFTRKLNVLLAFVLPRGTDRIRVANHASFAGARTFAATQSLSWSLAKNAGRRSARRVYAEFLDATGGSLGIARATIVFDNTPPSIADVIVRRRRDARHSLKVYVEDTVSGPSAIEVRTYTNRRPLRFPFPVGGSAHVNATLASSASHVRVRPIDRAGNAGRWQYVALAR